MMERTVGQRFSVFLCNWDLSCMRVEELRMHTNRKEHAVWCAAVLYTLECRHSSVKN